MDSHHRNLPAYLEEIKSAQGDAPGFSAEGLWYNQIGRDYRLVATSRSHNIKHLNFRKSTLAARV